MSDTTCLDELLECGISGRYEDIIRDRAVKNGKDKQLVDNAINLLNDVENMASIIYNCNLTTCRYNENGKCTNEEKRKECVEVAKNVLLVGSYDIYGCDTYSVNIKPTIEPLNTVKVSVLYNGTKETKWIDCIYTTYIKLEPKKTIYGIFSYNGNKISEKRILKWKYR